MGNSTHATALREGEPQAKTDRQSATAKEDRSKRAYGNRTSIPYGKSKEVKAGVTCQHTYPYQFPMGKVKYEATYEGGFVDLYQFPMGKVKPAFR